MTADRHVECILGAGERVRLPEQCELHRMEAELLFDRIGVDSGWRALDLACGPLDILGCPVPGARCPVPGARCAAGGTEP